MCSNNVTNAKYSMKTLVGYWKEKREMAEIEEAVFLDKCSKAQLFIQKMALLKDTFLKPTPILGPRDNYLHYNERLGLVCLPPLRNRVFYNHSRERPAVILAANLDEQLIYGPMKLQDNLTVIATTMIKPIARSVFRVTGFEGDLTDRKVVYGTPVQFVLVDKDLSNHPMYLASDYASAIGSTTAKSGQRKVFLHSNKQEYNTFWKFQHVDPQVRLESEGQPVPVNARVILRHCKTNSALAIEHSTTRGFFGMEYEVSTCDHLDGHRVENDNNQMVACTDLENWKKYVE